jgi:hypothetical protein
MGSPDFCPICGKKWTRSNANRHHCSKRTFSAIDGHNARAWEKEHHWADPFGRPPDEKLKDGLKLIYGDDHPDNP